MMRFAPLLEACLENCVEIAARKPGLAAAACYLGPRAQSQYFAESAQSTREGT